LSRRRRGSPWLCRTRLEPSNGLGRNTIVCSKTVVWAGLSCHYLVADLDLASLVASLDWNRRVLRNYSAVTSGWCFLPLFLFLSLPLSLPLSLQWFVQWLILQWPCPPIVAAFDETNGTRCGASHGWHRRTACNGCGAGRWSCWARYVCRRCFGGRAAPVKKKKNQSWSEKQPLTTKQPGGSTTIVRKTIHC
jgi:hypothetical protein